MKLELIKNVSENEKTRNAFFDLARKVFDLDFEPWYLNGFLTEKYKPYMLFDGEKAVSNVSVNQCDFSVDGKLYHFFQLGTVMTDPAYRNLGLSKRIMEEIFKDYDEKSDGYFLFANDSVLEFYPRFGFQKYDEYMFVKDVVNKGPVKALPVPMNKMSDWKKMQEIIESSVANSKFTFMNNSELDMFYLSQFMKENVFYIENLDAYVVAEIEEDTLTLMDIFSTKKVDVNDVIRSFGEEIKKVVVLFTLEDETGFTKVLHKEEDTTLFMKGDIENVKNLISMFPVLCHA